MSNLPKLIAGSVFAIMLNSFVVLWGVLFKIYYSNNGFDITLQTNDFNEFYIEFALLTFGIIFLPVLLYELDALLTD